ncbi:MAG TPA: hypothetical protein VK867_10225, partial [Candidatus Limnocylindrales bacterium]|nr:hypothetical protein [Candidatus Limnocylindrales bacterium]
YSCFATSLPTDALAPVAPIAAPTQAAAAKPLPRSDSAAPPAPPVPGWLVVLATVVVIGGIAMILRPARR